MKFTNNIGGGPTVVSHFIERPMLRKSVPNILSASAIAAMVATLAMPAVAQTGPALDVSGQIGIASEFIGKGIGKSNGEISPFASVEFEAGSAYASVFVASAELAQGADAEIISAIGYRSKLGAIGLDLSVINRDLPGTRAGVDSNYFEYQVDASRKFGPVSARLRVNYTPDGFAATQEAWWTELQGTVSLDDRTKLSAAIADRTADGGASYAAWNIGAKRKLTDRISLDLRYFATDSAQISESYEDRLVASIALSL